jgi:uncharacterized membrane protein YraQ (UPF0718 family)
MAELNVSKVLEDKWLITIIVGVAVISVIVVYTLARAFSIDTPTLSLIIATAAVVTTVLVTVLDATILERRRQQTKLAVERGMLRAGLYDEMADIIHVFHQIVFDDRFLGRWNAAAGSIFTQLSLLKEVKTKIERFVSFGVYNSASREPVLFFGLGDEGRNLNRFYKMIRNGISERDSRIDQVELWSKRPESRVMQTAGAVHIDAVLPFTEEDFKRKLRETHDFLQNFVPRFLGKALSYIDEDSLDYLGQCIDLDDLEYFVRLKATTDSNS